jgi:hypothetical protein
MNPEFHRQLLIELLQQLERIGQDLASKSQWVRGLPDTVQQPRRDELGRLLHNSQGAQVDRGTLLAEAARRARTAGHFRERTSGYEHECWLDDRRIVIATLRVAHPVHRWLQVVVNPPERSADCPVCPPMFWVSTDLNEADIPAEAARVAPWVASQILRV